MAIPPPRPSNYRPQSGAKGYFIVAGFVGAVLAALYPVFVYPYLHIEQYQEAQRKNRPVPSVLTQPGNMRVWSDPFAPRDDEE